MLDMNALFNIPRLETVCVYMFTSISKLHKFICSVFLCVCVLYQNPASNYKKTASDINQQTTNGSDLIFVALTQNRPNYDMSLSRVFIITNPAPFFLSLTCLSERMSFVMFSKGTKREEKLSFKLSESLDKPL